MAFWRSAVEAVTRRFRAADDARTPGGAGDDFWYSSVGWKTGAGIRVTPDVAIKASAVFACVNKIAKIMSTLPLRMYRLRADGGQEQDAAHPLDELVRYQPNETDTAVDFWHFLIWHAILRGEAYAQIVPGARGAIQALKPLHSGLVRPERLQSGRWRFSYRDPFTNIEQRFLQDELLRFPGLVPSGVAGLGICECADEAIAIALAADGYAARVFSNNLNMGYILSHPNKMGEEAKKNFLDAFEKRASGVQNAHRPILIQEGMKVEKPSQTAQEAQLIEARKHQLLEICRALDMPPHMVGADESEAKGSAEEQSLNFVRFTLQPWAKKIEQSIRRDLIVPDESGKRTHKAEFNFDSLLRGDSKARAEYFSKALGSGGSPAWLSVNEVRTTEGYNPLDGNAYDTPATGTNPISPDGAQPPAVPADGTDDAALRLLRKEMRILTKAAMRFHGDVPAWQRYAREFYGGFASDVVERCKVSRNIARKYCAARVAQCAEVGPQEFIAHLEKDGLQELSAATTLVAA